MTQNEKRTPPGLLRRAEELRNELTHFIPELLTERTGSLYTNLGIGSGEFHLQFWGEALTGSYPGFRFFSALGDELPDFQQLMLLYYFTTADGFPITQKFVAYADLPGGRMYAQAFDGYTGGELVKFFKDDIESFKRACSSQGGIPQSMADASFEFQVLPRFNIQVVYWLGDEDFPSSCKILFDASATHYLPIDACALAGSSITHKLIKEYSKPS